MKNIPYASQHIDDCDIRSVTRSLKSAWITQGPRVKEFETALSRYTSARYAACVSSGTAALHLSVLALNVQKGDEIITSPITFAASANCALYAGARPRFVDIDDKTYHIDTGKLKDFLKAPSRRKKVKLVIPVHFMGTVSDIVEIRRICDEYGISVLEDAAHALGAEYKYNNSWGKVGNCKFSDAAIFSFHPIKHITTGEGGAILTNSRSIYKKALKLRHHGIVRKEKWNYDITEVGFNYRITDFQCALGLSQLKKLADNVKVRRKLVSIYNEELSDIKEVRLPNEQKDTRGSYHLYVIRVPKAKRSALYNYLAKKGISTQVNYTPLHLFSYYRKTFGYKLGDFPVSEKYYGECLSLPLYASLAEFQQRKAIEAVRGFFGYE